MVPTRAGAGFTLAGLLLLQAVAGATGAWLEQLAHMTLSPGNFIPSERQPAGAALPEKRVATVTTTGAPLVLPGESFISMGTVQTVVVPPEPPHVRPSVLRAGPAAPAAPAPIAPAQVVAAPAPATSSTQALATQAQPQGEQPQVPPTLIQTTPAPAAPATPSQLGTEPRPLNGTSINGTVALSASTAQQPVVPGTSPSGTAHKSWFALFSLAFLVKALCMMSNVVFAVSPIPQVRQFTKSGDTGEADAAPYISILFCSSQWCFYGLFAFAVTRKSGFLVLVYSNIVGSILGAYYTWGFQANCRNQCMRAKLHTYFTVIALLATLQMFMMVVWPYERALFFCGLISSVCSVVGACSLLTTLPKVIETQCSASINVPLLYVGLGSSLLWLLCGVMLWDPWIGVPNLFGISLQLTAFGFASYYPREPPDAFREGASGPLGDDMGAAEAAVLSCQEPCWGETGGTL